MRHMSATNQKSVEIPEIKKEIKYSITESQQHTTKESNRTRNREESQKQPKNNE